MIDDGKPERVKLNTINSNKKFFYVAVSDFLPLFVIATIQKELHGFGVITFIIESCSKFTAKKSLWKSKSESV